MNPLKLLRRFTYSTHVLVLVSLLMLTVQFGHLHMHNHDFLATGAPQVHVLGGHAHDQPHDQSGEIDLQFHSLIAKVKLTPDLLPLVLFVSLLLALLALRVIRHEVIILFLRPVIFTLRPPSRASP